MTPDQLRHRLRAIRQARHLSQRQVADASGLSRNFISAVERGQKSFGTNSLLRYIDALGMPLSAIFGDEAARQDHALLEHAMIMLHEAETSTIRLQAQLSQAINAVTLALERRREQTQYR